MLPICAAVGSLAAEAQPSDSTLILKPRWVAPSLAEQFYPPYALQRGKTGVAKIRCKVTQKDTLTDCQVVSETPTGLGFGAAVLGLGKYMRLEHLDGDHRPVEGRSVELRMQFNVR